MTRLTVGRAILAGAGTLALASSVNAQTQSESTELSEVVVTGSRVIRNGDDSPTPVTVVTVEDIQATRPTTVYEGLLDMPQLAGSRGTSASNPGGAGANNNNINAPNLRGLGSIRTLVLYDGHRMPPTQQDFLIDANLIPQMLLQRLDVVTGGASAVYGSDAMSGVVNFITDRKFQGVKVQARGGTAQEGDSESYDVGIAFGTDLFGGRGHFMGSLETNDDKGIPHRTDRDGFVPRWTTQGSCAPTPTTLNCPVPFYLAANATISNTAFGGKIISGGGTFNNYFFSANGVASPFTNGASNGVAGAIVQLGGDGAYNSGSSLKAALQFHQAYARFDFDLTDRTHFFLSTSGTKTHQLSYNGDSRVSIALSTDNPYLPATVAAAMPRANTFTFNKLWGGNNPAAASPVATQNGDLYVDFLYINTGFEGSLGDYRWEASYTYGDARQHAHQNAGIDYGRFLAATDAVRDTAGNVVCNVTLTNPGLYPGCVPVNLFGPTSETQAAVDYFVRPIDYHTRNRSDDVAGSITGSPFEDWAGPVGMALSGGARKLKYELQSGALPSTVSPLDCTGLRFNNCRTGATNQWLFGSTAERPQVDETVTEGALEVNVPLLHDKPWFQAVDLNSAVRYTRYSITGNPIVTAPAFTRNFNAITWKAGLTWDLNDQWTVRASRSRDFRAPNLDELFRPASIAINNGFGDILNGNAVPPNSVVQTSGNPNLDPEIAYQSTLGFVYKPTPDFSIALDGYTVRVRGFIPSGPNGVSGTSLTFQQVCLDSNGTSPYCDLIERSPTTGLVTKFYSTYINLGEQRTYGADLESSFRTRLFDRAFSIRGLFAYQPHVIYTQPGVDTVDAAGTINGSGAGPVGGVVRASVFLRYAITPSLTADWLTRWRSSLKHNTDSRQLVQDPVPYSPSTAWSNLNLAYQFAPRFGGQASAYVNVQNVFNQLPHPVAFSGAAQEPGLFGGLALGDDPVGRYFTVGVRYKF
jgi:iron complex outermembrane receptor protein